MEQNQTTPTSQATAAPAGQPKAAAVQAAPRQRAATQARKAAKSVATQVAQRRERVPYWDNVKLVLIFLVVLGHFLYSRTDLRPVTLLTLAIYTFHMPAFAFVSGRWSRSERSRSFPQLARLGVAYVAFNGLFVMWAALRGGDVLLTYPYYSFWYLLALIAWRLSVGWVSALPFALPLSFAAAIALGFWQDAGNVFAFGRTIAFYPFFLAGYLLPTDWERWLVELKGRRRALIGAGLFALSALVILLSYRSFGFTYDHVLMEPYARMRDMPVRVVLFGISCLVTGAILVATPNRQLPLLTDVGRNTLTIYLWHRYAVLVFEHAFAPSASSAGLILGSLVGTVAVLALFGNPMAARVTNALVNGASALVTRERRRSWVAYGSQALLVLLICGVTLAPVYAMRRSTTVAQAAEDPLYPRLTAAEETELGDAYTILFAGDLILLEDQVRNGYTGEGYDFTPLFEYTKPYIEKADLAIGVFEGPMAGEAAGYSSGNFDDTKPFWVNFPDEFATAVADAGFDLVTTANNHLFDRGVEGSLRTLEVLDKAGIAHVGSYRSPKEKQAGSPKIMNAGGLKLAVLSYTYGVNDGEFADFPDDAFVGGDYADFTSTIVSPNSSSFSACRKAVEADLARAREAKCDLIVVLPHWGTQFTFAPDELQQTWRKIFLDGGADIILGDHTHSVQPLVLDERDGRMTCTCYCPGNYTNVYRDHDGDASALVEVKVSRSTKQVIGASVIPLWTASSLAGNYRPLPVYDILNDKALAAQVSTHDLERVDEVQRLVTSVMLGEELGLGMAAPRLTMTAEGFKRASVSQIEVTNEMREGVLGSALADVRDVCFVGDSVTEGTRNGGFGWYEPIESLVQGTVSNVSVGGATVQTLLGMTDRMIEADADLYVVAVGTNDVRYRDESTCAMTAQEYVERLGQLVDAVRAGVPDARFCFVAPWTSTSGDVNTPLYVEDKRAMNAEYTEMLRGFCESGGFGFVDANPAIEAVIDTYPQSDYLVDFIHPNATDGIELYASAALGAKGLPQVAGQGEEEHADDESSDEELSDDEQAYDDGGYDDSTYDEGTYDDGSYDDGTYDDGQYYYDETDEWYAAEDEGEDWA